jgi:hypothetical protein
MFYYHPSDERIVLSHALFWVMSQTLKGRVRQWKHLLLLRQYEEEMLDAFLQEDECFSELLRYCNILYEFLPIILMRVCDLKKDKEARRLAAMGIVAGGYGGDMPDELANELLDDIDFDRYGKVKCRAIEQ